MFNNNIKINIAGILIDNLGYDEILQKIMIAIENQDKIAITYVTAEIINKSISDSKILTTINNFDIIHPDGIGVFWASKILSNSKSFSKRFTGSDFYPKLIRFAVANSFSFFFFGDTEKTLDRIHYQFPELSVSGIQNGYNFNNDKLISQINTLKPNILVVGLGSPLQEKWIIDNFQVLNVNVIISVGDGIKVFAGNKKRGSKFIQIIGLEWLVRLINNPKLYWKRYLIGIPIFIFRITKLRLKKQEVL